MRNVESAGFWARAAAAFIDTVLFLSLTVPLMWLAYGETVARIDDARPWSLAINWLLPFAVAVAFWATFGATPGKMLMSLRIVDAVTGRPASPWRCMLRWAGYLASALPLGLGFLWAAADSNKRAWHDMLAGTRVVRPRQTVGKGEEERGYFASHWHGDLSLPVSFWVNNVLLSVPVAMALGVLVAWISLKGELLQASSLATLIGWPLMLVMNIWCIVGAWRSASVYRDQGGAPLWSGLTKLLLVLSTLSILSSTFSDFVPQVGSYLQMVRGIDPIGQVDASLSADGRRLVLKGPLGMGDATRVQKILEGADKVRLVELESPGGRVYEADRIAKVIRDRAWQTRATGNCESACTLVFMAGTRRQLMPGAQLGFHRAFAGTFNPVLDRLANQELAAMYRRAGLPEDFIVQTLRTPPWDMWYPQVNVLAAGGLISAPHWTLDVELPNGKNALASDMTDALRANPTWHALEQRFPGSIDAAANRMTVARARNTGEAVVHMEGQRVVETLLRKMLLDASAQSREHYLALLVEQLKAAQLSGNQACRGVLLGDAATRRGLPAALVLRESQWMIATAAEPPERTIQASTALELEVIRRSLGDGAPRQLAMLRSPDRASMGGQDCSSAIALLEKVMQLRSGVRQLATRMAFQRP
jgi:uncharacterized RDD family membrane protein YckC